jgi:hypothetical protein
MLLIVISAVPVIAILLAVTNSNATVAPTPGAAKTQLMAITAIQLVSAQTRNALKLESSWPWL